MISWFFADFEVDTDDERRSARATGAIRVVVARAHVYTCRSKNAQINKLRECVSVNLTHTFASHDTSFMWLSRWCYKKVSYIWDNITVTRKTYARVCTHIHIYYSTLHVVGSCSWKSLHNKGIKWYYQVCENWNTSKNVKHCTWYTIHVIKKTAEQAHVNMYFTDTCTKQNV